MYNVTQLCYVKTFSNIYLFLKMTTHRLKTQNMVKLEISTNYDTRVTVQVGEKRCNRQMHYVI